MPPPPRGPEDEPTDVVVVAHRRHSVSALFIGPAAMLPPLAPPPGEPVGGSRTAGARPAGGAPRPAVALRVECRGGRALAGQGVPDRLVQDRVEEAQLLRAGRASGGASRCGSLPGAYA